MPFGLARSGSTVVAAMLKFPVIGQIVAVTAVGHMVIGSSQEEVISGFLVTGSKVVTNGKTLHAEGFLHLRSVALYGAPEITISFSKQTLFLMP